MTGHSPDLSVRLDCGPHGVVPLGRVSGKLAVAHLGRRYRVPPCRAVLVASIDGAEVRRAVRITGFRGRATTLLRDEVPKGE